MIGLYGPVVFGVVGGGVQTFDQMRKQVSARWGTHEVHMSKPLLEYGGPQLIELTFIMTLIKPVTVDPTGTIRLLQETMDLAIPWPLIIGKMPMGRDASLFVMESLGVNPEYFFRGGTIIGANVEVKLKEYPTSLISSLFNALGGLFRGGFGRVAQDVGAPTEPGAVAREAAGAAHVPVAIASRSAPDAATITSVAQTSRT